MVETYFFYNWKKAIEDKNVYKNCWYPVKNGIEQAA